MKGTKKMLVALLSAACMTVGSFGMTACKNNESNVDSQIYAVYQSYVASAENSGETALSYEAWLESIKGAKGDKGDKGDKGETGATGAQGEKGETGSAGAKGDKGDKGDQGATGATGATGAQGPKGDQGATGEKGDKGEKGDTGATGTEGVGIKSVRTVFADKWKIAFYYEFTLTDGSKITTEEDPIIMVIPGKYYEVESEQEREILLDYGVEYEYIRYTGTIVGVHANVQTIPVMTDVPDEHLPEIISEMLSNIRIDVQFEQGGNSVALSETDYVQNIDFTQVGLYYINGNYEGFDFRIPVVIVDEQIPQEEKQVLYVGQDYINEYPVNIPVEELLNTQIIVIYNNSYKQEYFPLSELDVDLSEVDTSVEGNYQVNATYEGFDFTVEIVIKDFGGGPGNPDEPDDKEPMFVMAGNDTKSVYAYNGTPVQYIAVYDNGKADLLLAESAVTLADDDDQPQFTVIRVDYELSPISETSAELKLKSGGMAGAVFNVNGDMEELEFTFEDYTFTGDPVQTLEGVNSQGQSFTLKTYTNGMSEMVFEDGTTYNVGAVCDDEPDEDDITWFNVVGMEYFNLQDGELKTPTVEGQETPADGSSRGQFLGQWNLYYAAEVYSNGNTKVVNGWSSASLFFYPDGRVKCIECVNGKPDYDWATWNYNSETNTVTISIQDASATVVIENGIMTYTMHMDNFTGIAKLRR